MTDVVYMDAEFDKQHNITYVPKKVKTLTLNKAGEEGQFLWFEIELEDGKKIQTGHYKEV